MNRAASTTDRRDVLPPHGTPPHRRVEPDAATGVGNCSFCGAPCTLTMLATLGTRCADCFRAYCASPPPAPAVPADCVPAGVTGRSWAYRLRWREGAGHPLTNFQRWAWRRVLGDSTPAQDAQAGPREPVVMPPAIPIPTDVPWCDQVEVPVFEPEEP